MDCSKTQKPAYGMNDAPRRWWNKIDTALRSYGMNDAPRRWWNKIDTALRNYGMKPTRADRCTYVFYSEPLLRPGKTTFAKGVSKNTPTDKHLVPDFEAALEYLLDPVTGSAANNRKVLGVLCLHVDDLLFAGSSEMHKEVIDRLRKEFKVGSGDKDDVIFTRQRIRWRENSLLLDQDKAVE